MLFKNKEELIAHIENGNRVKYLFFWGHQKSKNGIDKSCLSQWYEYGFEENSIYFKTAEHYMMYQKAIMFGAEDIAAKVLSAQTPGEAKSLGREVIGFNQKKWDDDREAIVVNANLLKFGSNSDLNAFLLNSGNRVLVEASPVDRIWGIGLSKDQPECENPSYWPGLNLLGFALMKVRAKLSSNRT